MLRLPLDLGVGCWIAICSGCENGLEPAGSALEVVDGSCGGCWARGLVLEGLSLVEAASKVGVLVWFVAASSIGPRVPARAPKWYGCLVLLYL